MYSRVILPLELRPSNGDFKKLGSQYYEELLMLIKTYHVALMEAEKELLSKPEYKSTVLESEKIFPKHERHILDKYTEFKSMKLQFAIFSQSLIKYHKALTTAEQTLENNGIR